MADFFGGILDSIRGMGDSVDNFLGNPDYGKAIAKGYLGSGYGQPNKQIALDSGFYSGSAASANPRRNESVGPVQSVDYDRVEREWLERLRRFAQMDDSTKVSLGK